MTSKQIREQFLAFFASKAHAIVESSPVVPLDDPTLMFTNAGMNQFKDVFLGTGSRAYTRAADTQKCIRAGGKHNDLDDVGQDTYHHTFFEMLGNWSFGDYFKKEAIEWAWELMTGVWGIEKGRLHATYFEGDEAEGLEPDSEAAELWRTVTDIDPKNIHPGNKKDNFWEMGETGPCGPCSEIHIDLTPDKSGHGLVNAGDPRVIELWNLVFIQFNRAGDGKLSPLPAKHVDTGMGFERLCAVLQGMERNRLGQVSNYDTDVFTPVFRAIQKRCGARDYTGTLPDPRNDLSKHSDHAQSRDRKGAAGHAPPPGTVPPADQRRDQGTTSSSLGAGGPAGYLITFHTYGTWLHGSDRGSVDRSHNSHGTPFLDPDDQKERDEFERLRQEPVMLDDRQRAVVDATIREVVDFRAWSLHALNVRTNHVHVVVSADIPPERVMNDFKSYATRRLRERHVQPTTDKTWTRHGSTRYLWNEDAVSAAGRYVMESQGVDLPMAEIDRLNRCGSESAGRRPLPGAGESGEAQPLPYGRGSDYGSDAETARSPQQIMTDVSYRVIADHVRCLTFAITDGAVPSNEGRGYVLRRILRRAVRYGRQYFDMHEPFLCDLVEPLVANMAEAFPELRTAHGGKNVAHVVEIFRDEEASFFKTLDSAIQHWMSYCGRAFMIRFDSENSVEQKNHPEQALFLGRSGFDWVPLDDPLKDIHQVKPSTIFTVRRGAPKSDELVRFKVSELTKELIQRWCSHPPEVSGEDAFKLHDTDGLPIDLTILMADELGVRVDFAEYERLMEEAREKARVGIGKLSKDASVFTHPNVSKYVSTHGGDTVFLGYGAKECEAKVEMIFRGDDPTTSALLIESGQQGLIVLDQTPFYAEKGGQVGDIGWIEWEHGCFEVTDTQAVGLTTVHYGICRRGVLGVNTSGELVAMPKVDPANKRHWTPVLARVHERRTPTMQNHTSTHLLNWALRKVLGDHVQQKGSLVDPEKTRFDFSHNKPVTDDELTRIEELVNEQIAADQTVYTKEVDQAKAREINSLRAVFGEKYPDTVRVVSVGADIEEMLADPKDDRWMKHAVEFCGGTHLKRSSEAKRFVLISEEGVAKGVRRVVGITGKAAEEAIVAGERLLAEVQALADKPPVAPGGPHSGPYKTTPGGPHSGPYEAGRRLSAISHQREERREEEVTDPPESPLGKGGAVGPHSGPYDSESGPDGVGSGSATKRRSDEEGASGGKDLAAALVAFQQTVNDSVIPIRVRQELRGQVEGLQKKVREQQKQASSASGEAVNVKVASLLEGAETVNGVTVVVGEVPSAEADALRNAVDWIRNKTEASAVLLVTVAEDKVTLIAGMSKVAVGKGLKAGELIKEIAPLVGGRGGGRPDMAQGGGNDPSNVGGAVERAKAWIADKLG